MTHDVSPKSLNVSIATHVCRQAALVHATDPEFGIACLIGGLCQAGGLSFPDILKVRDAFFDAAQAACTARASIHATINSGTTIAAYEALRDCWLSGQISEQEMQQWMADDPQFAAWMQDRAQRVAAEG